MSRAASMQVLNQAFANANDAFATIMNNRLARDKYNLDERNSDRNYTLNQAAADLAKQQAQWGQSNADRNYGLSASKFDWEKQQAAQKAQNSNVMDLYNIVQAAKDEPSAIFMANALNYAGQDPVATRAFIGELFKTKRLNNFKNTLNEQRKYLNSIYDRRMKGYESLANISKNNPYLANEAARTIGINMPESAANTQSAVKPSDIASLVEKGVMDPEQGQNYIRSNYRGFSPGNSMTPEQALAAYKEGRITKEELAKIRSGF